MKYTAAHWGSYTFDEGSDVLCPVTDDPNPSRIGKGWVSAARHAGTRIRQPAVRQGWLDGDGGANRCNDRFVEVTWDRALDLVAERLGDVRDRHGNGAIFAGSYGWASAGRLHHAQSQMRRFLNLAGGFVGARETYSHAAAEVLFPYIMGLSNTSFQDDVPAFPLVAEHCELLVSFGGLSTRTAQIVSAGTSSHELAPWLDTLKARGVRVITIGPERNEAPGEWWPIRPGTDTALILALICELVRAGRADEAFLARCTSGWDRLRAYVLGGSDGQPKDADWAAPICDLRADDIRQLARDLSGARSLINLAWGLQRADHGEQPIWAGLALAAVLGQIGQPGTGYAFGYGSLGAVGRPKRLVPWPSFPQGRNPVNDYIPVARIADMLLHPGADYPYSGQVRRYPDIKLVWWCGGNPFHHHQDLNRLEQAWTRPETVIVNDHSWTATARRADIVLPSTTPLERADIMMNRRDPALIYMSPMMEPFGQARDDHAIFADLAERMGFGAAFTEGRSTDDWLAHLWALSQGRAQRQGFALPDWDHFRQMGRFDVPDADEARFPFRDFVADPKKAPLKTESGKLTLFNETIAAMNLPDCPGHPAWIPPSEGGPVDGRDQFHLISGQPETRLHSQNDAGDEARAAKLRDREVCQMHPNAAERLGLEPGDILCLSNARGACLAALNLSAEMREDCVSLPTGAWFDPQDVEGTRIDVHGNPNVLTLDKGCSGLSQGNSAHTAVVSVRKWDGALPPVTVFTPPV